MTLDQYKEKLLCFVCAFGKLNYKYVVKLKLGEWCAEDQAKIHEAKRLLDLYKCLDLRELPTFPGTYDIYTKEQFLALTKELENSL
jgi:hypothetical protein